MTGWDPTRVLVRFRDDQTEQWLPARRALLLALQHRVVPMKEPRVAGEDEAQVDFWREIFRRVFEGDLGMLDPLLYAKEVEEKGSSSAGNEKRDESLRMKGLTVVHIPNSAVSRHSIPVAELAKLASPKPEEETLVNMTEPAGRVIYNNTVLTSDSFKVLGPETIVVRSESA